MCVVKRAQLFWTVYTVRAKTRVPIADNQTFVSYKTNDMNLPLLQWDSTCPSLSEFRFNSCFILLIAIIGCVWLNDWKITWYQWNRLISPLLFRTRIKWHIYFHGLKYQTKTWPSPGFRLGVTTGRLNLVWFTAINRHSRHTCKVCCDTITVSIECAIM